MCAESQTILLTSNQWFTAGTSEGSPDQGNRGGWKPSTNWKGVSPVGWLTKGILSVLGLREIANPAVLLVVAVCLQETANLLVFTFGLAIGLWMVS